MSLRNAMRKAAGLLVELPPEEEESRSLLEPGDLPVLDLPLAARLPSTPRTVEEIVRDSSGPDLDQIKVDESSVTASPTQLIVGGKLDFAAIYRAASLPPSSFGAEQMLDTLNSLPADLPLETKRITVKSLLGSLGKSLGATPETVVADASRKLAALSSFANFMERKTGESVSALEKEITELELQISTKRAAIEAAKSELAKVTSGCEAESDKLDDVLEFFSLDVYPSKHTPVNDTETA